MLTKLFYCLLAIRSFSDYRHVGDQIDQDDDPLPHYSLIVNHHNANLFLVIHEFASDPQNQHFPS
jgi:hypothetical protein